jgi:type I restriction-modification system S subunit
MTKFKRYDSYKNSGVEWLGEIPSHWEISKLKFIGKIFAGLSDKKGDDFSKEFANDKKPFIPFTNVCNNLKIDKNQMQYVKISPYEMQNKVREKDIIFLMSSETLDDIGKCSIYLEKEQLYLNSFCKGFRPNLFRVNAEFLNYLLQSKTYRNYFNLAGRGFTRINIKQEYIANLLAVLPPKFEQEKIALYLDEKIAKIDASISGKEKFIELLKEQKQIIINDAVTKGLNKNAKFKNSGVEWLGQIPSHWEVAKVSRFYQITIGKMLQPLKINFKDTLQDYICAANLGNNVLKIDNLKQMWFSETEHKLYKLKKGDLVVVEGGDIGSCDIIKFNTKDLFFQNSIHRVRAKKDNNVKFLRYWLINLKKIGYIDLICNKATIPHFTKEKFENLICILPPKDEQEKIVEYIENKISKIDKLINLEQEYIKKLKEYKASLIDSVVTGKVKV